MKTALITGTTSGFGKAFAFRLAQLGYNLIITGRREDRLLEVASEIRHNYVVEVFTLCFDVEVFVISNYKCDKFYKLNGSCITLFCTPKKSK